MKRAESSIREILGRSTGLFEQDWFEYEEMLAALVKGMSFLIVGGAGSIGSAVVKMLARFECRELVVIDLDENGLAELVRDIRATDAGSSVRITPFAICCGSHQFDRFIEAVDINFEYVLNFSALKHVRSEKDPFTLSRMFETNIINAMKLRDLASSLGGEKYFCVSTDKASEPVNLMGASKRLMEEFCFSAGADVAVSSARFANVAFSNGSLLHGFKKRIEKKQPLAAPTDIRRFFMTADESAQLCLFSILLGKHGEIFIPKETDEFSLTPIIDIAGRFLRNQGLEPVLVDSPQEARKLIDRLDLDRYWPIYGSTTDTSGEKLYEEFWTQDDLVNFSSFKDLGVISFECFNQTLSYTDFRRDLDAWQSARTPDKAALVALVKLYLEDFTHEETSLNLNEKM